MWESLSEELINDSPFHSDLDPVTAPVWVLELRTEERLNSSLWNYMQTLQNFREKGEDDTIPLLNRLDNGAEETESDARHVFDRLSGQGAVNLTLPTFQSYLPRISVHAVRSLVDLIFQPNREEVVLETESHLSDFKRFKSCNFDNLTWRIVHVITFVHVSLKDLDSVALIWRDVIHRLRKYWESGQRLPG